MQRHVASALVLFCALSSATAACTFFSYAGDGLVLFGNSEDHADSSALIWYLPSLGNEYGCLFLGFDADFAQGGMNTAGLAFDAATIAHTPLNDHPELPTPNPINVGEIALRRCATIEEVVALIQSYNVSYLQRAQLQFTDRSGRSVVVAPGPDGEHAFIYSEAAFQVTTNTNVAVYPITHKNCPRHRITTRALERIVTGDSILSIAAFAEILGSVANLRGPSETTYSNVFDLTHGVAYIYYLHRFDRVGILDLASLDAAGKAVSYTIQDWASTWE
ncbi:MAG: hypothetical protein ABFD77_03710 [Thermotogota bacterium]